MKKVVQFMLIFCLMLSFIISCPALTKTASAGGNENITPIQPTSSLIATPSRYAGIDEEITWPPTLEDIIDYIMNIPFIQDSVARYEESKVRRDERRENWKNRFNTD